VLVTSFWLPVVGITSVIPIERTVLSNYRLTINLIRVNVDRLVAYISALYHYISVSRYLLLAILFLALSRGNFNGVSLTPVNDLVRALSSLYYSFVLDGLLKPLKISKLLPLTDLLVSVYL
jgi:hypothetical protein